MENKNREDEINYWLFMLMALFNYDNHLYSRFADSIILENRFIPTDAAKQFFEKFESFSKQATGYISKDKILYRARVLDESYNINFNKRFIQRVMEKDFPKETKALLSPTLTAQSLFESIFPLLLSKPEKKDKIISFFEEYKKQTFQGFDASGSGAAPATKTPEGRLNPQNISYLYMAEDADTAIYEVKPIIQQAISLATLKPMKPMKRLKILNLCKNFHPDTVTVEGSTLDLPSLMQVVAHRFSIPNHGDVLDYIPTQYIAEYVKNVLGFDGIKFKSSLKNGGKNVVIFDKKLCEVTGSKVYCIDKIKIDYHSLNQDIESINWENNEL